MLTASVLGTTLTINLTTPIGVGETFQLNFPASATLTDSGGNTPTGQTNLAITNNSAVTVRNLNVAALPAAGVECNAYMVQSNAFTVWSASLGETFLLEFVTDATEICVVGLSSSPASFRLDGATASSNSRSPKGFWGLLPLQSAPLTAGQHLVLLNTQYCYGIRLSGGTRSVLSVATAKRSTVTNAGTSVNLPTTSPEIYPTGAYKVLSATVGNVQNGTGYVGLELDVGFTATGVEASSLLSLSNAWVSSVDGAAFGNFQAMAPVAYNNSTGILPLAVGYTPGVAHTMRAINIAAGNTTTYGLKLINGTLMSSASIIGAGTIDVADVTHIAANDWVKIGRWDKREWRQVTGIAGSGPYTLTLNAALAIAHASATEVVSYSAAAGTFTAWKYKDLSAKRILAIGDSNTQAWNDYGATATPDPSGNQYTLYDPRTSPMFIDGQTLSWEVCDSGIQGRSTAQMAADVAVSILTARSAYDFVTIWAGTNDINSLATTPAAYQASMQTIVTAVLASLRAGGKVFMLPPGTPQGTTNAGGLNLATAAAACQAVAAGNPSQVIYAANLLNGIVAGDISGNLHWHLSGQTKIAANLLPYLGIFAAHAGGVFNGAFNAAFDAGFNPAFTG